MSGARVLLMTLSERTSAKGNAYLSGWLGKAQVVGFKSAEPDKYGNPVWEIFVSAPAPKDGEQSPTRNAERGQGAWDRSRDAAQGRQAEPPQGWLDDSAAAIADLGRDR